MDYYTYSHKISVHAETASAVRGERLCEEEEFRNKNSMKVLKLPI